MTSSIELTKRIRYAVPNDVFAGLNGGGSIAVEDYPEGGIEAAAARAERIDYSDGDTALVISLALDNDKSRMNTVWMHPETENRLEIIDRLRVALDDAEAALLAVGYVDNAGLRGTDYVPVPQREHNAFLIGQDAQRLTSVPSTSTDTALEG